jgi:ligand-binding sensor protein
MEYFLPQLKCKKPRLKGFKEKSRYKRPFFYFVEVGLIPFTHRIEKPL